MRRTSGHQQASLLHEIRIRGKRAHTLSNNANIRKYVTGCQRKKETGRKKKKGSGFFGGLVFVPVTSGGVNGEKGHVWFRRNGVGGGGRESRGNRWAVGRCKKARPRQNLRFCASAGADKRLTVRTEEQRYLVENTSGGVTKKAKRLGGGVLTKVVRRTFPDLLPPTFPPPGLYATDKTTRPPGPQKIKVEASKKHQPYKTPEPIHSLDSTSCYDSPKKTRKHLKNLPTPPLRPSVQKTGM